MKIFEKYEITNKIQVFLRNKVSLKVILAKLKFLMKKIAKVFLKHIGIDLNRSIIDQEQTFK